GFSYVPDGAEPENFDLEISGGWSALSIPQCNLQSGADAHATWLAGNGGRVLEIYASTSNSVEAVIEQIGITLGETSGHGGGLLVFAPAADVDVRVDRCAFIGNEGRYGSATRIDSDGRVQIRSSLVLGNTATNGNAAVFISNDSEAGVYLINNSVIDNDAVDGFGGVYLNMQSPGQALLVNNVLWGNTSYNLSGSGGADFYLHNNDIEPPISIAAFEDIGNIEATPAYAGGALGYAPAPGSPLIDAGRIRGAIQPVPVPFDNDWGTGNLDFYGEPRVQGGKIDIGAFEATPTLLFDDGFE